MSLVPLIIIPVNVPCVLALHAATFIIWKQAVPFAENIIIDGLTRCDIHYMASSNTFLVILPFDNAHLLHIDAKKE